MRWHSLPTKQRRARFYERWVAILAFVILGEVGLAEQLAGAQASTTQLAGAGLPVGPILIGASIVGIVVSLVIFRTPHDGQTEL